MKVPDLTKGLVVATLFAASVSVSAVAVFPQNPPIASFVTPDVANTDGTLLHETISAPDTDVSGRIWWARVTSRVYMEHPDNPMGYSFEYVLENDPLNTGGVSGGNLKALQIESEPMSSLNVGYVVSSGTVPQQVGFFDTAGQKLTWQWAFGIGPLSRSATLVVHSPYKGYSLGPVTVAGDGSFQTFNDHYVMAVPEPSTYAGVFALGLAGFAAYRRFQA